MKLKYAKYYDIVDKIGEGSYGVVYDAVDTRLGKRVAIKKINDNFFGNKDKKVQLQKVKLQAKIEANGLVSLRAHPNIVNLVDLLLADDAIYIIMEHIEGKTLEDIINLNRSGKLSAGVIRNLFNQILDAINFAHEKSIIHLDIKPANILIQKGLNVKVVDFGISKTLSAYQSKIPIGTPRYMSPEQIAAEELDAKTDIYGIGMTMLTSFLGKSIYDKIKDRNQLFGIIKNVPLSDTLKPYSNLIKDKKMKEAIIVATEINKANRFRDCNEFIKSLN